MNECIIGVLSPDVICLVRETLYGGTRSGYLNSFVNGWSKRWAKEAVKGSFKVGIVRRFPYYEKVSRISWKGKRVKERKKIR